MIKKIYSNTDSSILLASIIDTSAPGRTDASSPEEILQLSALQLPVGKSIKPHKHLDTERQITGTQEAWVIISGEVTAQIFDFDNTIIFETILTAGTCMILYRGGHTFTSITDVQMFEIKNGPYFGSKLDSQPIECL